jgi:TetR/AcrR family transcriptional repressor of lmrAB and yxaGH operons
MYGFEGVSLTMLSEKTGLEKSSMYYRYPAGKDQIVTAVAEFVLAWFASNVFEPLRGAGTPRTRVSLIAGQLNDFYSYGSKASILDVLSIRSGPEELRTVLNKLMLAWIDAFTDVARQSGFSAAEARSRAEEAIIRIEGSLVLARSVGTAESFERTLAILPDFLVLTESVSADCDQLRYD